MTIAIHTQETHIVKNMFVLVLAVNIVSLLHVKMLLHNKLDFYSQAHIPTYILSWMTAIINPIIYVICNPAYRESAAKKFKCLAS